MPASKHKRTSSSVNDPLEPLLQQHTGHLAKKSRGPAQLSPQALVKRTGIDSPMFHGCTLPQLNRIISVCREALANQGQPIISFCPLTP
jgi:hypothetical protein